MTHQPKWYKRLLHNLMHFDRVNQPVQMEEWAISLSQLPAAFHGARITVVADVHFPDALLSLPALTNAVSATTPDAIFLCGDLTNSYTYFDEARLAKAAQALSRIAPCFAVPGNHELRLNREARYGEILRQNGVTYLCDTTAKWVKDGKTLTLFGMGRQRPKPLPYEDTQPTIVLAHKPEYLPYYRAARWDLVVCGHAHGGQVRIGNRALFAPGQGFLPRFIGGIYTGGHTVMVVSRGLGNSSIPWRVQNRPHLPVIILETKQ